MVKALEVEMSTFLNQYLETYTTFDADQIAGWYCVPTITMRADGSINCFQCREIAQFFQKVADIYQDEGATSGTMHDLEVVPIGAQCSRDRDMEKSSAWLTVSDMEPDQFPTLGFATFAARSTVRS